MSTAKVCVLASMLGLLATAAPVALAQGGLRLDGSPAQATAWPRWQARLGLSASASAIDADTRWQVSGGQLLGDYYWGGLRPAGVGRSGGFRATSGLLLGQRSIALGTPNLAAPGGTGLPLSRSLRPMAGLAESPAEPWSAVPYVGIGYSGMSLRGGWGFTADFGLASTGGLGARRDSAIGIQGVDELLREWRLTPVLQFGASYAF